MPKLDAGKDNAELVILSLLEGGKMYGYAISKEVAQRSTDRIRLSPGVLYPMLRAMEEAGLIVAEWEEIRSDRRGAAENAGVEGGSAGRRRKWYKLSPKGRRRLAQRVEAHNVWRSVIDLFIGNPREKGAQP